MKPIAVKAGGRSALLSGAAVLSAWCVLTWPEALAQSHPSATPEVVEVPSQAPSGPTISLLRQAVEAAWSRSAWARAQAARQSALEPMRA